MASLNKVILIGHMVADPELKQTQTGVSVCSFRIGIQRKFKGADGKYASDFIDIVTWRQTAEFVTKYFNKGKSICVVGSLQQRSWTDQQGQKRYSVEVIADEVSFVDKSETGKAEEAPAEQSNPPQQQPQQPQFEEFDSDLDLPF